VTTHAMVDIETLGTKSDCVVLTVGGVKFDPFSGEPPHSPFLYKLDIDQQKEAGRVVDEGTLEWWSKQDPDIRDEAFDPDGRISVNKFCNEFNKWLVGVDKKWAQGPRFDYGILEHLFEQFDIHKNWFYWDETDSRTLFSLVPGDPRKNTEGKQIDHHSALADAYNQAVAVQESFKLLRLTP
jgi:hypothetical protein